MALYHSACCFSGAIVWTNACLLLFDRAYSISGEMGKINIPHARIG